MKVYVNDSFWNEVMGDKAKADIRNTGKKLRVKSAKTNKLITRNVFEDDCQRQFIKEGNGFRQIQKDKYGFMGICGPLFERV